jgi:hypothetical protein
MRALSTTALIMPRHLASTIALALAASAASAADSPLLPADQAVAGASQSNWSRSWWQWAASFDNAGSPVSDRTGARCGAGQQEEVWFLAGTYGNQRILRACSVPAGKYLFFPLINYVAAPEPGTALSCSAVMDDVRDTVDGVTDLVLRIDGKAQEGLQAHRIASQGCFDLGARRAQPGRKVPSAGDGYYVMLAPLPAGTHKLEFGGRLQDMTQAITYTLQVR